MVKIVHIAQDQKFIDWALASFERAQPGANELVLVSDTPGRKVSTEPYAVLTRKQARGQGLKQPTAGADLIVLHSLGKDWLSFVGQHDEHRYAWLGWGFDYYDLIVKRERELHLPATNALLYSDKSLLVKRLRKKAQSFMGQDRRQERLAAIKNITTFSPVLGEEYPLPSQAWPCEAPEYASWNDGTVDNLMGNLLGMSVDGTDILVGNSATSSCNHLEVFELLKQHKAPGKAVVPLSYGDKRYGRAILRCGSEVLGEQFLPLVDFIPLEQYIATLRSCGFVIMNHIRQQALGSIVTMLHMGAKVFLREECPTYQFFKKESATVYSVQELEREPSLLSELLPAEDVARNREVVERHWSSAAIHAKTAKLLKTALATELA